MHVDPCAVISLGVVCADERFNKYIADMQENLMYEVAYRLVRNKNLREGF